MLLMLTSQWLSTVCILRALLSVNKKGKVLPYSLPSLGPGAHPGVQATAGDDFLSHPQR